jgi:hypothetical protein
MRFKFYERTSHKTPNYVSLCEQKLRSQKLRALIFLEHFIVFDLLITNVITLRLSLNNINGSDLVLVYLVVPVRLTFLIFQTPFGIFKNAE